ncbi:hypothetical protein HZC53_03005 [Candidatus Uhrbacteria bacterium]|nr:hypothetical protein [Candidatus Uhrbacteria bacterium]
MLSKEFVVGQLVDLLASRMDPALALAATLGGNGLEVGVWLEKGIKPEFGWLIERSEARVRRLMRNSRGFHLMQGNLARFPEVFRSSFGDQGGLDMFHWDLCGTVEPAIDEICGVLPLLAQGHGRLLGVTVADSRVNRQTRSFVYSQDICRSFYGPGWDDLRQALETLFLEESRYRAFDVDKAILREAGTLMYLALAMATVEVGGANFQTRPGHLPLSSFLDLLRRQGSRDEFNRLFAEVGFCLMPVYLERYSYASDISGFRMRTYFIGLQTSKRKLTLRIMAKRLVELLQAAPSYVVDGEQRVLTWPQPRLAAASPIQTEQASQGAEAPVTTGGIEKVMSTRTVAQIREAFAQVLALPLPNIKEDFETLCQLAEVGAQAQGKMKAASDLLTMVQHALNGTASTVSVENDQGAEAEPVAGQAADVGGGEPVPGPTLSPSKLKKLQDLAMKDQARLELLTAKLEGDAAFAKKRKEIVKRLGIRGKPGHKLGSIMAFTSGKFRGAFVARVIAQGRCDLEELGKLLNESAVLLMREARAAGYQG